MQHLRSLIHDGDTSFLVPPGDIDAFVQKLILLQTNPTFRVAMGAKARKEAEQWSWEVHTTSSLYLLIFGIIHSASYLFFLAFFFWYKFVPLSSLPHQCYETFSMKSLY